MVYIPGDPKKYSCLIKLKIHNKRELFKTEFFKLPVTLLLHFVAIWQKYEYSKSDKNFENCSKYAKNGLSMQVKNWIPKVPNLILEQA